MIILSKILINILKIHIVIMSTKTLHKDGHKITVGLDDFCSNCMEWREYDEEGKCKKCGKLIKKEQVSTGKDSYSEYETEDPTYENDEQIESDDY